MHRLPWHYHFSLYEECVLLKRSVLIVSPWLVQSMEQSEAGLISNEAELEDVFQPSLDIQSTAPDQS